MDKIKIRTKFGTANEAYKKYRPTYPKALFEKIMERLEKPYKSALDLGAGTGISTRILAGIFEHVTAVEPDEKMIRVSDFGENVQVLNECTENISLADNHYDLITAGNAFYWMDAERVLKQMHAWLRKGGIVAAYRYNLPLTDHAKINEIICRESERNWDQFRHERLKDVEYTYRNIKNCSYFIDTKRYHIDNMVSLEPERFIGFFASTSYGSTYLRTLNKPQDYLSDLLSQIKEISDNSTINVDFSLELVIAANI